MNIWLVNPFDGLPGESLRPGRYAFLARMLVERGHRVTWWSSSFCHATKACRGSSEEHIPVRDNLEIVLVKTPKYDRNISLRRILNHYEYAEGFKAQAERCADSPDVIVASAPPLLAANAALAVARRRNAKVIIDVQDLWPEAFGVVVPRGLAPVFGMLLLPLRRFADRVYDEAHRITAVSNTFLARALSASRDKAKGAVVPLGVDLAFYRQCLGRRDVDVRFRKGGRGGFWVVYIGTIGVSYDIGTVLDAARALRTIHPDIRFLIAGDGPQACEMRRYASTMGLANVTFTGMISYPELSHLLRECDVGINPIVAGSKISMPNKCFDYMAAGLPMISSVSGELESLIAREGIGLQYVAGDARSLVTALVALHGDTQERLAMAARASALAEEKFDMNKTYARFEELALGLRS